MDELFYIWSMEHQAWWRPDRNGYTSKLYNAGQYTRAQCDDILYHANWGQLRMGNGPHEAIIPVRTVELNSVIKKETLTA